MKEIYTVYKDTRNMSRAEWLAARKAGIGGSDAAAIIGLNPFSSPLTVWADKTSTDEPQEDSESERHDGDDADDRARRTAHGRVIARRAHAQLRRFFRRGRRRVCASRRRRSRQVQVSHGGLLVWWGMKRRRAWRAPGPRRSGP